MANIAHRLGRKWLLGIAFAIPGIIGAALVGQFAIQVATDKGVYSNAGQRFDRVMTFVLALLTSPIATHFAALMLGVGLGLLVDWKWFRLTGGQAEPPPRAESIAELKLRYPHAGVMRAIDEGCEQEFEYGATRYSRKIINVPLLFAGNFFVEGVTFEDCVIAGPAVIMSDGRSHILRSTFLYEFSEDEVWLTISDERAKHLITCAYQFKNCTFIRCKFYRVSILGTSKSIETLRAGMKGEQ